MGLAIMRGFEVHEKLSAVRNVLRDWEPGKKEKLGVFLARSLEGYPIQLDAKIEKTKIDALVAHEVIVHEQAGFESDKDYESLVALMASLKGWPGGILIILTGKVKASLRAKTDDYMNRVNNDLEFM